MLKISRLTDYATTIMVFLAKNPSKRYSARDIAASIHIKQLPTVSKILKLLLAAHLVQSTQGVHGGYQLARMGKDINFLDVVCAIEGCPALTDCCSVPVTCPYHCILHEKWNEFNTAIIAMLKNITLADVL